MPLNRTPPQSANASPLPSEFVSPLQHYASDTNIPEIGLEAGLSAASSLSNLSATSSINKVTTRKNTNAKRKRAETNEPKVEVNEISKAEIMDMFKIIQAQQSTKFEVILSSINELKTSMEFLSAKYYEALHRIDSLAVEREKDRKYIMQLENRLEILDRNTRRTCIELRNVPQNAKESKEDLKKVIINASQVFDIQLQTNEIKDIYRLNTKAAIKPIIVDFITVQLRDSFLSAFKNYNKHHQQNRFNTTNVKIEGPSSPIFISENLTVSERKLFYLAREFSKNQDYTFCWTSFGRIFMRKREGSPQIRISNVSDLDKLKDE